MVLRGENRSTWEKKTCSIATLSTTTLTRSDPEPDQSIPLPPIIFNEDTF
jgi:hypothetical protein